MPDPAFKDVKRAPPLTEQIYARLREMLHSGAFAPGEKLIDASLAQSLGVSRTPVREALSRLAADGLLETGGRGFQVARPSVRDMEEIFEIRRMVEPPAAWQSAQAMTDTAFKPLALALEEARKAEKASDFDVFAAANYAFRAAWVAQVPSRKLRDVLLRLDDQSGLVRRATLVLPEARADALRLLEKLTPAFRDRDTDAAASLTTQFIDAAARYYRELANKEQQARTPELLR